MILNELKALANKAIPKASPIVGLKIGSKTLVFDGVIEEQVSQEYQHTVFPTQEEAVSSDFSYRLPLQVSLTIVHSDTQPSSAVDFAIKKIVNLGLSNIFTEESMLKANSVVSASFDFVDDKIGNSQESRSAKMLQNLFNLAKKNSLFEIQTTKATYKNMAIQQITYRTNESNFGLALPVISFVERKQHGDEDSLYDPDKMIYEDTSALRMSSFKNLGNFANNVSSYVKGLNNEDTVSK